MFITTSIYFLMLFLIFWSYCGYTILLLILSAINPVDGSKEPASKKMMKIAIIVPCYNEESYVAQKVDNLKKLNYEQDELEVYFLNGLSTDKTGREINKHVKEMTNWHLIQTKCKGKINQINYGLSRISKDVDIIVSTDMDAVLEPDVLTKFVDEFNSDDRVAVVGANISPKKSIPIEEDYWRDQNLMRMIESTVYTSSIVIAPCYAYKASFIDRFPEDCVADDIYIAFKANTEGYLTKYVASAAGYKTRTPESFEDFFSHKFRKGNAFLIELFRFYYRLPQMPGSWKLIYLTKVLQLAVMPWALLYFVLASTSLFLSGVGLFRIASFGLIFLFCSMLLTSFLLGKARNKYLDVDSGKIKNRPALLSFIVSNLILILAGVSYPFYQQTSSYQKINTQK